MGELNLDELTKTMTKLRDDVLADESQARSISALNFDRAYTAFETAFENPYVFHRYAHQQGFVEKTTEQQLKAFAASEYSLMDLVVRVMYYDTPKAANSDIGNIGKRVRCLLYAHKNGVRLDIGEFIQGYETKRREKTVRGQEACLIEYRKLVDAKRRKAKAEVVWQRMGESVMSELEQSEAANEAVRFDGVNSPKVAVAVGKFVDGKYQISNYITDPKSVEKVLRMLPKKKAS